MIEIASQSQIRYQFKAIALNKLNKYVYILFQQLLLLYLNDIMYIYIKPRNKCLQKRFSANRYVTHERKCYELRA